MFWEKVVVTGVKCGLCWFGGEGTSDAESGMGGFASLRPPSGKPQPQARHTKSSRGSLLVHKNRMK